MNINSWFSSKQKKVRNSFVAVGNSNNNKLAYKA